MTTPRQCFYIPPGQSHPTKGYVPSLVTEDEAGHAPLAGRGELSEPWFWGTDYDQAVKICDKANLDSFGLRPEEAKEIVASSVAASIRGDARVEHGQAELARKLGRRS